MKKIIFLVLFLFGLHGFSQQTKSFSINWLGNIRYDIENTSYIIPQFSKDNYVFNPDNRSLKFKVNFKEDALIDQNSLKVTNLVFETIDKQSLGDLDISQIPESVNGLIYSRKSREELSGVFECDPLINENGVIKKLISFQINYQYQNSTSFQREVALKSSNTNNSVLASGNWYRFSLQKSGAYKLTKDFLEKIGMGLSGVNPRNIKVFGNGGGMLPLSNSVNYPLDLQEVNVRFIGDSDSVFENDEYIVFYGEGVDQWNDESLTHLNLYDNRSYYYLLIGNDSAKEMPVMSEPSASPSVFINTYDEYLFYEVDTNNPVRLGRKWVGDDFSNQSSRNYSFKFANIDVSKPVYLKVNALAASNINSSFTFSYNSSVVGSISFQGISADSSERIKENSLYTSFFSASSDVVINMNFNNNNNPSAEAYMDYIWLKATSFLKGSGKQFMFKYDLAVTLGQVAEYQISNASGINEVWDLSDIYNVTRALNSSQNDFSYKAQLGKSIRYLAVDFNDLYTPSTEFSGRVSNQNLKGEVFLDASGNRDDIDYLIITANSYKSQAQKLATFHQNNSGLKTKVVTLNEIYHEFSSGKQDIAAIRNLIKYVYDNASSPENRLKFVCLFGGASYDYKDRVPNNTNIVPVFHSINGFSLASTFMSDDFYGLMDFNEGTMQTLGGIDVTVGRMIFSNISEAETAVNKVINYYSKEAYGQWRNDVVLLSDDVDADWESVIQQGLDDLGKTLSIERPFINIKKIHSDSYVQETSSGGQRYPEVRKEIVRTLEKGTLLLDYFGHGGEDGLAKERILEKIDVQQLSNTNHLPLIITATCEFSRFDNPYRPTAGEYVYLNSKGGAISLISTTRQIGVTTGLTFNEQLMNQLFAYQGSEYPTIADALRRTKNVSTSTGVNIISYIGDPALKLAIPKSKIVLTHINDVPVGASADTLKALSLIKLKGIVTDASGNLVTDYNGIVVVNVFDKNVQTKTLGNDNTLDAGGQKIIMDFEVLGDVVFKGNASVKNGVFEVSFVVPKDIKMPIGNGRISFYSRDDSFKQDQTGVESQIKIGGYNNKAIVDNTSPKVKLYMNNDSFVSGGIVNTSPTLIAYVEDENGVNTAGGIGHDIVAYLDGDETKPFILNDFYETNIDDYKSGKVNYKLFNLEKGMHTIQFRVWDVYNNPTTTEVQFFVASNEQLVIDKVLNYPNPFINYTEFWFQHNKPNEPLEVQVQVFTISGKLVKTINQIVVNDGFLSREIRWDGLDDFGDKIGKGTYVYKLSVKSTLTNQRAEKIEKLVIF